jgi:hypothetical protein
MPVRSARPLRNPLWWAAILTIGACDAVTSVALQATDFAGAKADAHCDRRFVIDDAGTPAPFCQEVVATVAGSDFADDCREKHHATAGPGKCPRERIIAGCKLLEEHDDKSQVWDWYYDVSDILADAGPSASPKLFEHRPFTVDDIARTCSDRSRYELGAELAKP